MRGRPVDAGEEEPGPPAAQPVEPARSSVNGLAPRDAASSAPRAVLLLVVWDAPVLSLSVPVTGVTDPWNRVALESSTRIGVWAAAGAALIARTISAAMTAAVARRRMVRQRSPPSSRGSGMRLAAGRSSGLDAAPGSPGLPAGLPGRGGQWLPLGAPVGRPHSGGTAPDSHRFPLTVRGVGNCTTASAVPSVSSLPVTASPEAGAPGLGQRLVEVPALRRLDARRAPRLARTVAEQRGRAVDPSLEQLVSAVGDAGAARMSVVDEDRRRAGLRVQVGGQAADVAAVGGGQQREQADHGVLGRVQRAQQVGSVRRLGGDVPDRLGLEVALRHVQGDHVDRLRDYSNAYAGNR